MVLERGARRDLAALRTALLADALRRLPGSAPDQKEELAVLEEIEAAVKELKEGVKQRGR